MKKIAALILLSCITIQLPLFSIEKKQDRNKKAQINFSKKDYLKLGAATLGCAWFLAAAAGTYLKFNGNMPSSLESSLGNITLANFGILFAISNTITKSCFDIDLDKVSNSTVSKITAGSIGLYSSLGVLLGAYASKKGLQLFKHYNRNHNNKIS